MFANRFLVALTITFAGTIAQAQNQSRLEIVDVEDAMALPSDGFRGPVIVQIQDEDERGFENRSAKAKEPEREDTEENEDEDESREEEFAARARATHSHLQKLLKPIHNVRLGGVDAYQVPENRAAVLTQVSPRYLSGDVNASKKPNRYAVCASHRPLYFEDPNLERCGANHGCLQNGASALRFISQTITLPYHLATQRPDCLVQSRGDCLSCQSFPSERSKLRQHGFDKHGLVGQAAAIAGFSFLLL